MCIYIYICAHTHIELYIYTCLYIYIYLFIYTYTDTYIQTWGMAGSTYSDLVDRILMRSSLRHIFMAVSGPFRPSGNRSEAVAGANGLCRALARQLLQRHEGCPNLRRQVP